MTEEMESLYKNQTWELVELPNDKNHLDASESYRRSSKKGRS